MTKKSHELISEKLKALYEEGKLTKDDLLMKDEDGKTIFDYLSYLATFNDKEDIIKNEDIIQFYPHTKMNLKSRAWSGVVTGFIVIATYNGKNFFFKCQSKTLEIINDFYDILQNFTKQELSTIEVVEAFDNFYWIFPRSFSDDDPNSMIIYRTLNDHFFTGDKL